MKRQTVKEQIFSKTYFGERTGFSFGDLPETLLPFDIIEFHSEEAFYSESNSMDAYSVLTVYREREETDEEMNKRLKKEKKFQEELRQRRHETYLKLKKEFEEEN